jgi:hypothetical protein
LALTHLLFVSSLPAPQAFDVLERMDPEPEYLEGKKGAACGAFQMVVAGKEPKVGLERGCAAGWEG